METVNKPNHYNKGEIDLYESWYLTRPFNEFRAIMESIAERYMKRDKFNRIEDLDKAIYTLTRLREYELREIEKNKNTFKIGDIVDLKFKETGWEFSELTVIHCGEEYITVCIDPKVKFCNTPAKVSFEDWEITKCEK